MKAGQRRYKGWLTEGFPGWLQTQLQLRDWSAADLAREAGVASTLVSRWMKGQRPAPDSLNAVAQALQLPYEDVWRAAGLGDNLRTQELSPEVSEIVHLVQSIEMTHERYLTLRSLLTTMQRTSNPGVAPDGPRRLVLS